MINGNEKVPENETDAEKLARLETENRELRKIWWMNHGCELPSLYGDDGELQCGDCMIDFKRDTVDSIMETIQKKNLESMTEEDHEKIRRLLGD